MTLEDAATIVLRAARSAGTGAVDPGRYDATDTHIAIAHIGNDFVNRTGCTLSSDAVALGISSPDTNFSGLTNFRPEFIRSLTIDADSSYSASDVAEGVGVTDLASLVGLQAQCTSTGTPKYLAFTSYSAAKVWPTPKADGSMTVLWRPPFTTFTIGTANPEDVDLNIAEDLVYPVLVYGAAVLLQLTEVEQIEKSLRLSAYNAHVMSSMGRGGAGSKISVNTRGR